MIVPGFTMFSDSEISIKRRLTSKDVVFLWTLSSYFEVRSSVVGGKYTQSIIRWSAHLYTSYWDFFHVSAFVNSLKVHAKSCDLAVITLAKPGTAVHSSTWSRKSFIHSRHTSLRFRDLDWTPNIAQVNPTFVHMSCVLL
jgi:hypothetical protein